MIGTRLAISEHDHQKSTNSFHKHDSKAVSEELPRPIQQHLVVWSQKAQGGRRAGGARSVDHEEYPLFRMSQNQQ